MSIRITGTGIGFPKHVVDNRELCSMLTGMPGEIPDDFGPEWILDRTGIEKRHFVSPGETVATLARDACLQAMKTAGWSADSVDGIVLATCTPATPLPSSAALLQKEIGAFNAFAFDLNAACSGFQHALATASGLLASNQASRILVVGSEVLSSFTDFTDRKSCILFGDGAGAVCVEKDPKGFFFSRMRADGREWDLFEIPKGGSDVPFYPNFSTDRPEVSYRDSRMQMKGSEIFKSSVKAMSSFALETMALAGMSVDSIDAVVPHQANLRILEAASRRMGLSTDKLVMNLRMRGNTSAATVPTALHEGIVSGKIKRGQTLLFSVFGAGVTYGSTLIRY